MRSGIVLVTSCLASAVLVATPTVWLRWEVDDIRAQAERSVSATALDILTALQGFVTRFESVTGRLRLPDSAGDGIALNERLLRSEAVIAPAVGLTILNGRGIQMASTTGLNQTAILGPRLRDQLVPPPGQIGFVGCGTGPSDVLVVRSIDSGSEKTAGVVIATLSVASLRATLMPERKVHAGRSASLASSNGCDIARHDPTPVEDSAGHGLLPFLVGHLPVGVFGGASLKAEANVLNLRISVSESFETAFGERAGVLAHRAWWVVTFAATMAALILTLGMLVAIGIKPAVDDRAGHATFDEDVVALGAGAPGSTGAIGGFPERDRVLAAIGHDIRSPLNSIMGICALLLDGDLSAPQRKWQQRIRASCEALLAMTNGMLEVATTRFDGAAINLESVDVGGLVEEVGDVLRHQAEDKGLELIVTLDDSVMGYWRTDATRLRQVLYNLCGNAIKYTFGGTVSIEASVTLDAAGACRLGLQVSDTGPGIDHEEKGYIFDRYRRGREEVSRGQEGVGLGLALCRDVSSLLGGNLSVESERGRGSTFTLDVPVERAVSVTVTGGPLTGRSALVVGFTDGMRRSIVGKLERLGMVVDATGEGFLAPGFAERMFYRHSKLDLLVLDAALRGLAADVVLARLQAVHTLARDMRTVLVSNGVLPASMSGRADAVIPHPVETRTLESTVGGLFGDGSILREVYPKAPSPPMFRVLVVEDSRVNQALVVERLTRAGISAHPASNGREAVEAASRGGFDAVLMDIQMPEMDGLQATRLIRAAEDTNSHLPIIAMTAHTGATIRRECMDTGMDLVLHKPLDFSALPLCLRQVMAATRSRVGATPEMVGEERRLPDVSREHLDEMVAEFGERRTAAYVDAFLSETQPNVSGLESASSGLRWRECMQLAHRLAGLSSTLGALAFADRLLAVEDAARDEDTARTSEAIREAWQTWERTRCEIQAWLQTRSSRPGDVVSRSA